jgi:hypothetical protein
MVRSTVELLLDPIEGVTDRSIRLEIDSELVARGSTRAVAENAVPNPGRHRKQSVGEEMS